ncbi:MAG: CehA/McbA family metallohydrolase [Planctomycetota bacterium]
MTQLSWVMGSSSSNSVMAAASRYSGSRIGPHAIASAVTMTQLSPASELLPMPHLSNDCRPSIYGQFRLLLGCNSLAAILFLATHFAAMPAVASTVEVIGPTNRFPVTGKETDWIDGDYVIKNDHIVAVIARPGPVRDANMTTRGVGACLIDLSRIDSPSDQLSCFYPLGGRYQFHDDQLIEMGELEGGGVFWRCQSSRPVADNQTTATIEYQLRDGNPFLTVITTIEGKNADGVKANDGVRADRTFRFDTLEGTTIAYCEDEHFRQTYGFEATSGSNSPAWSKDRMRQIQRDDSAIEKVDGKTQRITRVYPASSPLDLWGITQQAAPQTFQVVNAVGVQPRIKLTVIEGNVGPVKKPAWRSSENGRSIVHLPSGQYSIRAEAIGHEPIERSITVTDSAATHSLELGDATALIADIRDENGKSIPCKMTVYGIRVGGKATEDPNFGLDSQSGSVGNCVYSANGQFIRSIPPGNYDVLISRGPEYDAAFERVRITSGKRHTVTAVLKRVVDTTGWISAELHSHSSPSGDNTSDQLGRVENLICEHLEFAPCTEHQRIESYEDQLEILKAAAFMATCSGMELTGSPLPINHQNAFPLKLNPFAQDGGGPRTSGNPVNQIARLTMWDDNADKVVQSNHPNLTQMLFDRDLNGTDDGGFAKMLDYMDVMEVHPPEDIFLTDEKIAKLDNPGKTRMKPWMDLIASGQRIPGVVNTDAHYNFHGSGWLRNWIRCSTDDPTEIKTEEMIKRLEKGEIIMSTGPFMTVAFHHDDLDEPAGIGDSVTIGSATGELKVRVQCPNWLDVNRVEVFINGSIDPSLSRTRKSHPQSFADGVVKFDQTLPVELPRDSFIIVAAIGEKMELGRVFGRKSGRRPPVVVSNPIYVSIR